MDMKNKVRILPLTAMVNAVVVSITLVVVGSVAIFMPERPTVSEIEKRELASFPTFSRASLMNGAYTKELSAYFADTFPLRDQLVSVAGIIREGRGLRFGDIRLYDAVTVSGDAVEIPLDADKVSDDIGIPDIKSAPQENVNAVIPKESISASPIELPPESELMVDDPNIEGIRHGSIFVYGDRGFSIVSGNKGVGKRYASVLNAIEDTIGDKVRIYNLVVPSSIEFYLPERFSSVTSPQRPLLDNISENLNEGIEFVDVYDTLEEHKSEYIFFRTDHHWTALGAYYAYCELMKTAGLEPVSVSSLEKRTLDDFLGTFYANTQDSKMGANPDYVDYYMMPVKTLCYQYRVGRPDIAVPIPMYGEYASSYNSYSVFLHGDLPVTRIDTDVDNGRRIAVVKESYGNAFAPFLVNNYEQVIIIDQRYLEKGLYDIINEFGINELLFINNISAAYTPVRIHELSTLPVRTVEVEEPVENTESDGQAEDGSSGDEGAAAEEESDEGTESESAPS